eukprot:TRINITY_DN4861_c0_g1_i2.p1 TRINITY_DN4861_c0_g1~~TRINITY_DN4861_c0_g1_i2.p1  ORF type:complete len:422 (-),score=77.51 TRINITY_DN4861_c0_g1_i2:45-1310(-)
MARFIFLLALCLDSGFAVTQAALRGEASHLAVEAALAPAPAQAAAPALPPQPFWANPQNIVLFIIAPGTAIVGLAFVVLLRYMETRAVPSQDLETVDREPENLDEDVYGAGITALVRDSYSLVAGKGDLLLRISRLASSFLLMIFVVSLQIWTISQMQTLVCGRAVSEIRKIYGRYEFIMYGADINHIYLTPNGFPRGLDKKYFDQANFENLTSDEQDLACAIPFSQPKLLLPILFIWTLTIVADLRRCGDLFVRLILSTPTISSMQDAVVEGDGETQIIVGLTKTMKAALATTCIIPRWVIDVYLLWLGCRWLAATPSFSDLLLNSVALEFIVLLKDALYTGVVPDRNKRATQNTLVQPWQKTEPANYRVFLSSFLLMAVTCAWVLYYVYRFQAVLPDYKWDVAATCKEYVAKVSSGKAR